MTLAQLTNTDLRKIVKAAISACDGVEPSPETIAGIADGDEDSLLAPYPGR